MPYTHCPTCRLATFSAAVHSSRDECPRCGTPLETHPRRLFAVPDAETKLAPAAAEAPAEVA
jgi:uncharacterized paraquat-inducible protein A